MVVVVVAAAVVIVLVSPTVVVLAVKFNLVAYFLSPKNFDDSMHCGIESA